MRRTPHAARTTRAPASGSADRRSRAAVRTTIGDAQHDRHPVSAGVDRTVRIGEHQDDEREQRQRRSAQRRLVHERIEQHADQLHRAAGPPEGSSRSKPSPDRAVAYPAVIGGSGDVRGRPSGVSPSASSVSRTCSARPGASSRSTRRRSATDPWSTNRSPGMPTTRTGDVAVGRIGEARLLDQLEHAAAEPAGRRRSPRTSRRAACRAPRRGSAAGRAAWRTGR